MNNEFNSNEILESVNGIKKSVPNNLLFTIIESKLQKEQKLATQKNYFIAASLLFLISINLLIINIPSRNNTNFTKTITPTLLKNNQLYE